MKMNILLLSALALVSASDFLELPFFTRSTSVTVPAKDGSNGVTFNRENRYANISINSDRYTTHLEPEFGDISIFEDKSRPGRTPPPLGDQYLEGVDKAAIFEVGGFSYDRLNFQMVYASFGIELAKNKSDIGGLGLGPTNSSTFDLPVRTGMRREWMLNFADVLKSENLAKSLAFTINPATECSPEGKLVYGAMDLSQFTGKLKALQRSPSMKLINAEFTIIGTKANATLEPEDPNSYLDDEAVAAIAGKFGAVWDENHSLYAITTDAPPQEGVVVDFDGLEIRVPPSDVWVQDKQDNAKWYFTVRPLSSSTIEPRRATIGADILKSVYIVYDLEHDRAAIGKAVRDPGQPLYEVFPAEGIPEKFLMAQGSCS